MSNSVPIHPHASPAIAASEQPRLSVVVACTGTPSGFRSRLGSLAAACEDLNVEIIVVDGSPDGGVASSLDGTSGRTVVARLAHPRALVPHLWAAGVDRCRGRIIALTTGEMRVGPSWARTLIEEIEAGAAAAGGPIRLASRSGPSGWAIFYLRFWSHLDESLSSRRPVPQLPGENVAYVADQLSRRRALLSHGVWEAELNQAIAADGGGIVRAGGAAAEFAPAQTFRAMVLGRLAHGRHSGATRIRRGERRRWHVVASAPAVPLLLAARAARGVLPARRHQARFLLSLPWFLVLAAAWAIGEAWGALQGSGVASMSELVGSA